jgi:hypothetical protein
MYADHVMRVGNMHPGSALICARGHVFSSLVRYGTIQANHRFSGIAQVIASPGFVRFGGFMRTETGQQQCLASLPGMVA